MELIALDDLVFADYGIPPAMITKNSTRWGRSLRRRDGIAASVFAGASAEPAQWQAIIRCPDEAARDALMATFDAAYDCELRLVAQRGPYGADAVAIDAALAGLETPGADLDLRVVFESADSVWTARDATRTTGGLIAGRPDSHAVALAVPGNATALPVIRLTPTAQRTTFHANAGWRYWQQWTIANNTDEPWFRFPVRISLGSTTSLISNGKALASGNDLRVVLDGLEQARTLVGWNSAASHVWVVVPALAPGTTLTYDILYGNPSAGSPPTLTYPDLPAFSLSNSTNAQWVYLTAPVSGNAGLGFWHLSATNDSAVADFGVPGAWTRELTWAVPTNTDNFVQSLFSTQATWVQPLLEAYRWHTKSGLVAFASAEEEAGWNPFDGVTLTHPLGITSINFGYQWINFAFVTVTQTRATTDASGNVTTTTEEVQSATDPVTRFVVIGRRSAAEAWKPIAQATGTASSLTTVGAATYTPSGGAVRAIGMACWPTRASIPADYDAGVRAISNTNTTVNIDTTNLTVIQSRAETEVYELATELRIGGGANASPPYDALLVGNARTASGEGTRRVVVPLNQTLVIDQEAGAHSLRIEDAAGVEQRHVSHHAVRGVAGLRTADGPAETYTSRWLPLRPARLAVPNGDFNSGIGGWGLLSATTNMTATLSHDAAIGGAALGSLKIAVTPNTAASGAQARVVSGRYWQIGARETVAVAGWSRTSSANLRPLLGVAFSTDADDLLAVAIEELWAPAISTGYRRAFAAVVPHGATRFRAMLVAQTAASSATGTVWWDDITVNGPELYIADVANGAITVAVDIAGRYSAP